jgi:hypothetical protein
MEIGSISIPKVLMLIIYIVLNDEKQFGCTNINVDPFLAYLGVWIFVFFWTMSLDLFMVAPNIFELRKMKVARNK